MLDGTQTWENQNPARWGYYSIIMIVSLQKKLSAFNGDSKGIMSPASQGSDFSSFQSLNKNDLFSTLALNQFHSPREINNQQEKKLTGKVYGRQTCIYSETTKNKWDVSSPDYSTIRGSWLLWFCFSFTVCLILVTWKANTECDTVEEYVLCWALSSLF